MKKLILILFLFCVSFANAQTPVVITQQYKFLKPPIAPLYLIGTTDTAARKKYVDSLLSVRLALKINSSEKGQAGGVATLDPYGYVPTLQLDSVNTYSIIKYKLTGVHQKDFTVDGQNARVLTPSTYSYNGTPTKLCIFFHYFGGNYTTMPPHYLRDSLLANGYVIVSMSTGDLWGNKTQQQYYIDLYNYCQKYFNVTKELVVVGMSMGGLSIMNILDRNILPIKNIILIESVVNLKEYYTSTSQSSIRSAYNFTDPDIDKATFGFDPYKRIKNNFGDSTYYLPVPTYFLNGTIDTSAKLWCTRDIYNYSVKYNRNIVFDTVIGVAHDTTITTSTKAHNIMSWLNNIATINRPNIDSIPIATFRNDLNKRDKINLPYQSNYINFQDYSGNRRGLFGFYNSNVIGNNGMGITNINGNIGLFPSTNSSLIIGSFLSNGNVRGNVRFLNGRVLIKSGLNVTNDTTIYSFEVNDTAQINAKFNGRVIGSNAVNSNEFVAKGQLGSNAFNSTTIPAAQQSSDWNSVTSPTNILNKPTITSGTVTAITRGYGISTIHSIIVKTDTISADTTHVADKIWSNHTFQPKGSYFTLPSLTSGSVLFSDGTTIAQDNANFNWNTNGLNIGSATTGKNIVVNATEGANLFNNATDFNASNWTLSGGWESTNDGNTELNHNGSVGISAALNVASAVGVLYKITFTITSTVTGGTLVLFGGGSSLVYNPAINTPTVYIVYSKTSSSAWFTFQANVATARFKITSIGIVPLTINTGQITALGDVLMGGKLRNPSGTLGLQVNPDGSTKVDGALTTGGALTIAGAISGATSITATGIIKYQQAFLTLVPQQGFSLLNYAGPTSGSPLAMSPSLIFSSAAWNTASLTSKGNAIEIHTLPKSGAVTSGSLIFANITVDGVANANELMRLTSGAKLGIGLTDDPTETLALGLGGTFSILGSSSGKAIINVSATAGTPTLTLPTTTGTLALVSQIPAAQVQSDWTQDSSGSLDYIKNKPTIPVITGKRDIADTVLSSGTATNYDLITGLATKQPTGSYLVASDISGKKDKSDSVNTDGYVRRDRLASSLATKQESGTYSTDIHSNIAALNAVTNTNTGDQDLSGLKLKNDSTTGSGFYTNYKALSKVNFSDSASIWLTQLRAGHTYEPKFSKNTGFNKAFGSSTGTVLEGRTFGSMANETATNYLQLTAGSGQALTNTLYGTNLNFSSGATFSGVIAINTNGVNTVNGLKFFNSNIGYNQIYAGTEGFSLNNQANTITLLGIDNATGAATLTGLAGTGDRMVVASSSGVLSTQAIPSGGGGGTVTDVSIVSANGFAGSNTGGTSPDITLTTTVSGVLYGNGTAMSSASSANIISALGYTPYSSTNPSGYITGYTETDPNSIHNTTSAQSANFNITGNGVLGGSITASGGGFNSLRSLKNIHKDWVGSATDELSKFKLRDFNYKTRPEVDSTLGFIIDEIPQSVAKYVLMNKGTAINTYTLHGLEVKAIQELTEKNKELEARIEKLEKLLNK